MAKAFLAGLLVPAAQELTRCSDDELDALQAELVELPRSDTSLQVPVPRLVTPEVEALLVAIEDDDVDALRAALPAVLERVDTPLERARLARAVIGLRDAGRLAEPVAAMALLDLANPTMNALLISGLAQSAAVMLGAERTPGGLLLAG